MFDYELTAGTIKRTIALLDKLKWPNSRYRSRTDNLEIKYVFKYKYDRDYIRLISD